MLAIEIETIVVFNIFSCSDVKGRKRIIPIPNPKLENPEINWAAETNVVATPTASLSYNLAITTHTTNPKNEPDKRIPSKYPALINNESLFMD